MIAVVGMKARTTDEARWKEIEAFNKRYVELHLKMDTAGILALWEEDGVDLMPGDAPMIGKKKIVAWVEDIVAKMPGYKVTKQEMAFTIFIYAGIGLGSGRRSIKWCSLQMANR
jgi:hypothetical protein